MKKKIIIGSIIAVAILVGVSLTSVVGYQSVESNLKESPLFNIRTSRAIDEESETLTYDYIGKNDGINLLIPNRNNKAILLQKFIERISMMDDNSYDRLIDLIFKYLYMRDEFQEYQKEELILYIIKLRNNPNKETRYIQDEEESNILYSYDCTLGFPGCPTPSLKEYGYLGCLLFYFSLIIILLMIG